MFSSIFKKKQENHTVTNNEVGKPEIPATVENSENNSAPSPMKLVKLNNGKEMPEAIVYLVMRNVDLLFNTRPIAFYEMVQKCRDPSHKMWGNTEAEANSLVPITPTTCDIINSAVKGDGLEMTIGFPLPNNRL